MREFLHHLFLPRESNNHRAKILHHKSVLLIIVFLLLGNFFLNSVQRGYSGVLGISANISVGELLSLTNQRRQEAGLAPLVLNEALSQAAYKKAQDMLSKNYWAHNAPDGTTPWVFVKSSGYDYLFAGENLARGFTTAPETVSAWMNSTGHRDNMLSANYKDIGFAVITGNLTGDETVLVVEMLGSRNATRNAQSIHASSQIVVAGPTPTPFQSVPTRVVQKIITVTPTRAVLTPTPSPTVNISPANIFVASVRSEPLVDRKTFTRRIAFVIALIFLAVLIADLAIISRKKIVRIVAHNIDHIIFISILLLCILIMGRGIIL
ncbi:MAG: hypothetical protein HY428_01055 [Candidatus Levybacteria bacterium]|nr:hypothetical protein [Candidatus Levybacteria bacterium]